MPVFTTYEDIFRQRADAYHKAMELFPRARAAEFDIPVSRARLQAAAVVCDAPAGGGYLRPHLPVDIGAYIAVEMAPDFVSHCPAGPGDRVVHSPLSAIDLPDGSVDAVLSIAGVHHLERKQDFYREAARILKPGGSFVLMDAEAGSAVDRFLNGFLDAHNSMGHSGVFLDRETASAVSDCGFEIRCDEVVHYPWSFDSELDMGVFCRLLFGMDLASERQVIAGVDRILGRRDGPGNVNLEWCLRLVIGDRLAP